MKTISVEPEKPGTVETPQIDLSLGLPTVIGVTPTFVQPSAK
jgi:hypothetical protein